MCLTDFGKGDKVKEAPCGHIFHSECIIKWLQTQASCPYCRQAMGKRELRKGHKKETKEEKKKCIEMKA